MANCMKRRKKMANGGPVSSRPMKNEKKAKPKGYKCGGGVSKKK